ncbi:MAG: nucleoside hydrolase [Planctomycetota bacterium]
MKKIKSRKLQQAIAMKSILIAVALGLCLSPVPTVAAAGEGREPRDDSTKIPVIYDTDIGDDIDDTWALGMILNSPELDVKLVVGDQGKPLYRARLIAKFLQTVGRTDVPVGIGGGRNRDAGGNQSKWVKDYRLQDYPGKVHEDGIQAIIDVIMASERPVTIVAVGPLPNIAEALRREPRIAKRARFVGMHGSVRLGYGGSEDVSAEYNVRANAEACRKVLSAPWDVTITPLDTCGLIQLTGERYQKVLKSSSPVAQAIIENYRIWSRARGHDHSGTKSSTLFDTVAVYLAFDRELVTMERLGIRVTDDGYTRIDPNAKKMNVATAWKNQEGFKDLLVERVTKK